MPQNIGVLAHPARARHWQCRGERFESAILHNNHEKTLTKLRLYHSKYLNYQILISIFMKKTLRNLMLAGATLFMAGNAYAATAVTPATGGTANPFAYALSSTSEEGVVTINYSLNADATAVAINLIGGEGTVVKTVDLEGDFLTKGAHTTTVELAGLSDGCYNWEVQVTGEAKTEVKEFFYQSFWHPSGLDIDNNPENASFGTLFVAEGYNEGKATNSAGTYALVSAQPDGSDGGGLYMFTAGGDLITKADGSARFYGSTLTHSRNYGTSATTGADFARVAIADDGRIFVTRHNDSGDYILSANSVADLINGEDFTSLVAGRTMTDTKYYTDDNGDFLVGPNQGFDVKGSGADTKIIALSCATNALSSAFSNNRTLEYAIGTASSLPSPTTTVLDKKCTVSYTRQADVQYDNRGGFWYCQWQGTPTDTKPALVYIDANGEQKYLEGDGGKVRRRGAIAVSPDGTKLAAASAAKVVSVYDITWNEDGTPTLTEIYTITVGGSETRALAWDIVGNLYASNSSSEYVKGLSLPRENNDFTTKAAAQYAICYTAPVVPTADPLYITGENIGGNWDPANAAEFEFDGENYVITVDENTTQFKISTSKGSWDEFNAGNLAVDAAITNGGTVNLSVNKDAGNIILPWAGVWTITVAADLSTLTATTETPEPAPSYDPLYMVGYNGAWDPSNPLEIPYDAAKGAYFIAGVEFTNTEFKLSRTKGTWEEFDSKGMCSSDDKTIMIGVPGSLYLEYSKNIPVEATGTYDITIDLVNKTILLEGTVVYPDALFLCGNLKDANWDPAYDGAVLDPTNEEGVYTIESVELVAVDGNANAYFSFNTTTDADWNNLGTRYGATSKDEAITIGENMTVVNGGTNPNAWMIEPGMYKMTVSLKDMVLIVSGIADGIEDITIDNNAPAVYYNLQGVEVANPENGVYIMKQGSKVTKVVK